MFKEKIRKKKYGVVYNYVEERLLSLRMDSIHINGELDNYEQTPYEFRETMVYLSKRYRNVRRFIDTLNYIKAEVNEDTKELIDLLYFENKSFEEVSKKTNIKMGRLEFRHKMLVDEVMEQMGLYNGPKRRYSKGRRRTTIPKYIQKEVRKRDGNQCTKCNGKENLHFHHIIRYADGGEDTTDNLILLCVGCHAKEHENENVYHLLKSQAKRVSQ